MKRLDLSTLAMPDAKLIQHGLKAMGYYDGTTRGLPGPKTNAAYDKFLEDMWEDESGSAPVIVPDVDDSGQSIPDLMASIARSKVGVREVPKNSNRGSDVEEFQRATWLDGSGWAWCAAFVCWVVKQIQDRGVDLKFKRPLTAGAWDFERWAREQTLPVKLHKPRTKIKKGDIVVFTFSHIGIAVEDEANGYVKTVEGNTDSSGTREGGGVYEQKRKTSLVRSNIRLI